MPADIVERFAKALQSAEQSRDLDPLLELFAEDATVSSPERDAEYQGREAIGEFWKHYLATFQSVKSRFSRKTQSGSQGVLEWTSSGKLAEGSPFEYRGTTLLEIDGERVKRFATYYDTAALRLQKQAT